MKNIRSEHTKNSFLSRWNNIPQENSSSDHGQMNGVPSARSFNPNP